MWEGILVFYAIHFILGSACALNPGNKEAGGECPHTILSLGSLGSCSHLSRNSPVSCHTWQAPQVLARLRQLPSFLLHSSGSMGLEPAWTLNPGNLAAWGECSCTILSPRSLKSSLPLVRELLSFLPYATSSAGLGPALTNIPASCCTLLAPQVWGLATPRILENRQPGVSVSAPFWAPGV